MIVDTGELKDVPDAVLLKAHRYGQQINAEKVTIGPDGRNKQNYTLVFWRGKQRSPFVMGAIFDEHREPHYSFHS